MKKTLVIAACLLGLTYGRADAQARTRLTTADAERIALAQVPDGTVTEIEREVRGGRTYFDVEVRDANGVEHELRIDAESGQVVRSRIDDDDDD